MANSRILLGLACLAVSVCAACGSSFTSGSAGGGNAGEGAGPSAAGSGASAAADSGGAGGETNAGSGGTSAGAAGKGDSAGAAGSGAGAGAGGSSAGAAGTGGAAGSAGSSGTAGGGGAPDCKTLLAEYTPLLEKARVCDPTAMGECSASSKLNSTGSCGCPVLVNAKSNATALAQKKYKDLQDNKCLNTGVVCNVLCVAPAGAACEQQMTATGSVFQCTVAAAN